MLTPAKRGVSRVRPETIVPRGLAAVEVRSGLALPRLESMRGVPGVAGTPPPPTRPCIAGLAAPLSPLPCWLTRKLSAPVLAERVSFFSALCSRISCEH